MLRTEGVVGGQNQSRHWKGLDASLRSGTGDRRPAPTRITPGTERLALQEAEEEEEGGGESSEFCPGFEAKNHKMWLLRHVPL